MLYVFDDEFQAQTFQDGELQVMMDATRPHGYIVKPYKDSDLKVTISIVLNNFNHKKIDPTRNNENVKDPIPFRIRKIVDYINDNLDKKIEIHDLAALTEWKPDHLIRLFSKYLEVIPFTT